MQIFTTTQQTWTVRSPVFLHTFIQLDIFRVIVNFPSQDWLTIVDIDIVQAFIGQLVYEIPTKTNARFKCVPNQSFLSENKTKISTG